MDRFKNKLFIVFFIILSVLPLVSLFHPGLPLTHDGQDHVARIANFYQNLIEGNLIPRWGANLNWGYGHPILEFLYPLPSYIVSLFHLIGFSLVDSTKIVYALGMVLSLIFMYLWLSQFSGRYAALLGAVLYTYAPYRFIDLYVRGDIGENLAFAFVPLVLFFIYKLYKENDYKYVIWGGVSLALLVLAHNAVALMFMPVIIVYCLLLIYLSKNRKYLIFNTFFLILTGFFLSAFFWVPALLEGRYTLRNIVTKGGYIDRFVSFGQLIYGPWNYGQTGQFTVQFGPLQWIALILSPFTAYVFRKDKYNFYLVLLLIFSVLLSVFIMLPVSNFIWLRVMLLQNFQFPWRFLAIVVFSTSVLGAFFIESLSKKINRVYVVFSLVVIILFISSFYWRPKGYLYKSAGFYTGVYKGTTDTGESSPIWSIRFMEHSPKNHMQVVDGSARIKELQRTSTYHKYEVTVNKRTLFEENTLYFPGWEIEANGVLLNIQFQDMQYRGVMLFFLDKGNYIVEAKYTETKLRLISDIISLVSAIFVFGFLAFRFVKAKLS